MINTVNKAIELLAKETDYQEKICSSSAYWIPLQWLYVRMIENKDLVPLVELSTADKNKYWNLVKDIDKPKWARVMIAQALYVYEKEIN